MKRTHKSAPFSSQTISIDYPFSFDLSYMVPATLVSVSPIQHNTPRQVLTNKRGEKARRHWIVFDGDVDPDWAENLNSVLDDNKILTLPSGERLEVPDNVRIMLEVSRTGALGFCYLVVEVVFLQTLGSRFNGVAGVVGIVNMLKRLML